MVGDKDDRSRRLGVVLWDFQVMFPRHDPEDEAAWKEANPEFAEEIAGFAEAARAAPIPEGDLDEEAEREIIEIVDVVMEADARKCRSKASGARFPVERGRGKKDLN